MILTCIADLHGNCWAAGIDSQ